MERFIEQLTAQGKDAATIKQYRSSLKCFCEWMSANSEDTPPKGGDPMRCPQRATKTNIQFFKTSDGNDSQRTTTTNNDSQRNTNESTNAANETPTNDFEGITQLDIANFKRFATTKWKPNTVRQRLTHLRAWFDYLVSRGEMIDNPAEHVDAVKSGKLTPKWLTQSEQNSLIRFVRKYGDIREYTIILLMLHTGLRVQELCDLRIDDIQLTDRKGKVIVRKGKHNRYREVPLNVDVRRVLARYIAEQLPTEFLFSSQRSAAMSPRGIQHIFEKYQQLTGIEHLSGHALRHSFLHELVVRKVPLDVVARLAGHMKNDGSPNIQQTLVYTAPSEEDLTRAVEELSWI